MEEPNPDQLEEQQIPKSRFDEATGKLKDQLRQAQTDLQTEKDKGNEARIRLEERQPTQKDRLSRAELLDQVEAEIITQAQADKEWENQIREDIRNDMRQEFSNANLTQKVNDDLVRYKELLPDLMTAGKTRDKAATEYNYLVSIGQPATASTELAAVRNVYGTLDKVKKSQELETHQEVGGGEAPEVKDNPLKLDARQKAYYEKRLDMGLYKDWDEVKAELEHKRK